jgi:hypothetical protein
LSLSANRSKILSTPEPRTAGALCYIPEIVRLYCFRSASACVPI